MSINIEGILKLANDPLITIIVKGNSGSDYQWMLNLVRKSDKGWSINII